MPTVQKKIYSENSSIHNIEIELKAIKKNIIIRLCMART